MTVAKIKEKINRAIENSAGERKTTSVRYLLSVLHNIKSMLDELDDRPKAKWVATERHLYMCTNCESEFIETSEHNYCPYCGARMEDENE